MVVVESAGRCHARTAAAREAVGPVVRLDPFGVVGGDDHFNPLDLVRLSGLSLAAGLRMIVELIVSPDPTTIDPYWRGTTVDFLHGALGCMAVEPDKPYTLPGVYDRLTTNDAPLALAKVLDTVGQGLPADCRALLTSFLEKGAGGATRSSPSPPSRYGF